MQKYKQCRRSKEYYIHHWKPKHVGSLLVKEEFVKSLHRFKDGLDVVVFLADFDIG